MNKALFITEKPSVAKEFAKALNLKTVNRNGYMESDKAIVTWCVGHLVNMSYPQEYDIKYKKWVMEDLPFLPKVYKYEVIDGVKKQFDIVKSQMIREDVSTIYVCTDSGREGEYIYRLVDEKVGITDKVRKRVWIDSQTTEEIKKGVRTAKPLSEYDKLSDSAYLRAKEDYLIGINFSRILTLKYGNTISRYMGDDYTVIAVGRVMTCVLAMVVNKEREIRNFKKTPYYKINGDFIFKESLPYTGDWKAVEGSKHYESKRLFKDVGFREKDEAQKFIDGLINDSKMTGKITKVSKNKEKKNPPLLFNLAELQNTCSKLYKLSPNDTLKVVQGLYEKKMLTYPRTDARVLSTAIAKEIHKNIIGISHITSKCVLSTNDQKISDFAKNIIQKKLHTNIAKTKYVNDKAITDHYAIIPTGQGLENYNRLADLEKKIFLQVVRRFLAIFYPPAIFSKLSITTKINDESFFTSSKVRVESGYMDILNDSKKDSKNSNMDVLKSLKKGQEVVVEKLNIKESETTPPKRYNSGSIILAMENAGKLIEDDELRGQIKGQGIGTSATRASILDKLNKIGYVWLNKKTQILTPTQKGEMIYDVIAKSIPTLLKPELTASWEKGLTMVANGDIGTDVYMEKLENYIKKNTDRVISLDNKQQVWQQFTNIPQGKKKKKASTKSTQKTSGKNNGKNIKTLGKCIVCSGDVLENTKAFYCSNWREGCRFTVWKNSLEMYDVKLEEDTIAKLLKNGKIEDKEIVNPNTKEKYIGTLQFKDGNNGVVEIINIKKK